MSLATSTQSTQSTVVSVNRSAGAEQALQLLLELEADLALPDALGEEARRYGQGLARRYPLALLRALASMSEQHDGVLAGFRVDPSVLRSPVAYAATMEPIAMACERIARRIRDEGVRRHREASVKAGIAITAMRREGTLGALPLESDLRVVRANAPRRRKAKAAVATPVVTPVTPEKQPTLLCTHTPDEGVSARAAGLLHFVVAAARRAGQHESFVITKRESGQAAPFVRRFGNARLSAMIARSASFTDFESGNASASSGSSSRTSAPTASALST